MGAILTEPVRGTVAWDGRELARSDGWIVRLTGTHIVELEAAVARSRALPLEQVGRSDFPLPSLGPVLDEVGRELEDGRGFSLLRGIPVERYTQDDVERIFWGVGTYLGEAIPQNVRGHLMGHVTDEGLTLEDPRARGYQTRASQSLHVDRCDVVGLLCLRKAKSGGLSRIVSSMTVYNELLRRYPWYVGVLYKVFAVDLRGEQRPGEPEVYHRPVFSYYDGCLSCGCNYTYIRSGQEKIGQPLTPLETEALDTFYRVAHEMMLSMDLEPGDVQFLNNYVILHDRTAYDDWDEPERKRHLLRLWLSVPNRRPLAPEFGTYRFSREALPA